MLVCRNTMYYEYDYCLNCYVFLFAYNVKSKCKQKEFGYFRQYTKFTKRQIRQLKRQIRNRK